MIDLNKTVEQNQIVDSVRLLLAANHPVARLRQEHVDQEDLGPLREFGAFTMSLPERAGGAGLSAVEDCLLHRELGRHLLSPSAIALTLAIRLANESGDTELLDGLVAGTRKVCLGNLLVARSYLAGEDRHRDSANVHLYDADGKGLGLILCIDGIALVDLPAGTDAEVAAADHTIRLTRSSIGTLPRFRNAASPIARLAKLLISAQLLGICEAARDLASEYAKVRTQFGQPIGSFQAIKHRCANMAINAEVLSAQLDFAAIAERDGWEDAGAQIDAAWLLACRYTIDTCRSAIQVHGGIGFSAECDAHLYLLRAQLFENLGGTAADRLQRVLEEKFWPATMDA